MNEAKAEPPDLKAIRLESGFHVSRDNGVCPMELVAWLAGRKHGDFPACTSLTMRDYATFANDHLDNEPRQHLKELAWELTETFCPECEQDRFDTLIGTVLRGAVCGVLRKRGMPAAAAGLEAALDLGQPSTPGPREEVLKAARIIEEMLKSPMEDDELSILARWASAAVIYAWNPHKQPALYQAMCSALPDSRERAPVIIEQIRKATRVCPHREQEQ